MQGKSRLIFQWKTLGLKRPVDLETWRAWFARALVLLGAVLFPLGSAVSLPHYISEGYFLLLPINALVWVVLLVRSFSRTEGYAVNAIIVMTLLYIIMTVNFVILGPDFVRPAWLVTCAVMAALMFGVRGAVLTTVLNAVLLLILYEVMGPDSREWAGEYQAPYYRWLVFVFNTSLLTIISSLPAGFMLNRLDQSLKHEREAQRRISREGERLKHANEALAREIELRRNTEKALRDREAYQRILFEKAPDGYYLLGPEGQVIDINQAMENMLGWRKEEVVGKRFYETGSVPAEEVPIAIAHFNRQIQGRDLVPVEGGFQRKDGGIVILEMNAFPLVINGEMHLLEIARDVTLRKRGEQERKQLEARLMQAQKMEAIGTLAGGIAHDFNNILSAVIGYTEMARADMDSPEDLKHHLFAVLKAGSRAKELVRQILTFSRQKTGREFGPVQVRAVVEDVLKMMRASLPSTIEIRRHLESEASVLADSVQIYQVLMNLCTNSGHAMMDRGGVLEVRVADMIPDADLLKKYPELCRGPHVEIVVKDTGKGIPPEVFDRIFDPYFTTKAPGEGSGLGLSIVHGIIKNCGGELGVQSEPGRGAVFQIYLPVTETETTAEGESESQPLTGNERILLVDDEPLVADVGRMQLEKLGYQVDAFTSSVEALHLFAKDPGRYDLVMTDMTMPEMTGKALAKEIMAIRADIPVILNTGFSHQIDQDGALQMGIRAFVSKPFNMLEISRAIRKVLDEA